MTTSSSYIVGVGHTPVSWARSWLPMSKSHLRHLAISAGTKALLDAGISYDDVDYGMAGGALSDQSEVFFAFGATGIPINGVEHGAALYAAIPLIQQGNTHCILVLDVDQHGATGAVVVSENFLWHHPYLKDTAIVVRGCARKTRSKLVSSAHKAAQEALRQAKLSPSDIQATGGSRPAALDSVGLSSSVPEIPSTSSVSSLCKLVWLLRGWKQGVSSLQNCLYCVVTSNDTATVTILARADGAKAPGWDDVAHKNDGRERLGYNPAEEVREIAYEDWSAVKARAEFSDEGAAGGASFRRKGGDRAALAKL